MIIKNKNVKLAQKAEENLKNWTGKIFPLKKFEKLSAKNFLANRFLAAHDETVFAELLPFLESVNLSCSEYLYQENDTLEYVYFPETAVVSEFQILEDGRTVEIAMTGREGVVGILPALNAQRAKNWTQVSISGSAFRISSRIFRSKILNQISFQSLLLEFLSKYVGQISQRSVCHNYHIVEQRFCSWLLMLQNRKKTNKLPLTQDQIARFLGVHRPSVTNIAQALRMKKIIEYVRGNIYILDRLALEKLACNCYLEIDKNL